MAMSLRRLHHVQVLCPPGAEAEARRFYGTLLGLAEIPRPATLERGGVWFSLADHAELHVGARRADDLPARSRAHFAIELDDLHMVIRRLQEANVPLLEAPCIPGVMRLYAIDPFDNRIELMQRIDEDSSSRESTQ
jgi:catechol 2,3-dioxygenase-like lactoylglutathione lyase family enzyme